MNPGSGADSLSLSGEPAAGGHHWGCVPWSRCGCPRVYSGSWYPAWIGIVGSQTRTNPPAPRSFPGEPCHWGVRGFLSPSWGPQSCRALPLPSISRVLHPLLLVEEKIQFTVQLLPEAFTPQRSPKSHAESGTTCIPHRETACRWIQALRGLGAIPTHTPVTEMPGPHCGRQGRLAR